MSLFAHLKALFFLISANQSENIALAALRDALLPRLISGEIDVSAIYLLSYNIETRKVRKGEERKNEIIVDGCKRCVSRIHGLDP